MGNKLKFSPTERQIFQRLQKQYQLSNQQEIAEDEPPIDSYEAKNPYVYWLSESEGLRMKCGRWFNLTHIPGYVSDLNIEGYFYGKYGRVNISWNNITMRCVDYGNRINRTVITSDENLQRVWK